MRLRPPCEPHFSCSEGVLQDNGRGLLAVTRHDRAAEERCVLAMWPARESEERCDLAYVFFTFDLIPSRLPSQDEQALQDHGWLQSGRNVYPRDVASEPKERCDIAYAVFEFDLIPVSDYSRRTKEHCRTTVAAQLLWSAGLPLQRKPLRLCGLNVRPKPRRGSPPAGRPPPPTQTPPAMRPKPWTGSHPAGRSSPAPRTPLDVRPKPRTGSPPAGGPPPPTRPTPTSRPSPVE